ncbi:MAG: hypothetical protein Q4B63_06515 [Clostridium perfringens]|nr:hypothetical protein [Clostridium perfringens]
MEKILKIKEKINIIRESATFLIEDDYQYYFFIGQLAYFIERKSKLDMERCCKAIKLYGDKISNKSLKEYIINRFSIYAYGFNENYEIFKRIFSAVLIYEPEVNIKDMLDIFYLGTYFDNLIFDFQEEELKFKREVCLEKLKDSMNKELKNINITEAYEILKN